MKLFPFLSLLVIFLLYQTGMSQTVPETKPKKLFWSEEPACGQKNASVTSEDKFTCSLLMEDEWKLRRFEYNGLILTVKFFMWGQYFVAETWLVNSTDQPKPFNIKEWSIVYFENEEAFQAGRKPMSGGSPVTAPRVAYLSDIVTAQSASTGTSNNDISDLGRTTLTRDDQGLIKTTPADASKPRPAASGTASGGTTVKTSDKLRALTEKVVPAKKEIHGRVYFALDRTSEFRFVSMPIDGVFYVFPVPKKKK